MTHKGTTPYLDALRSEIQRRFGRSVRTKTDCQQLEDQLFETTGQLVSYNTLRRFFGLVPGGEPRTGVLDILSAYCGFADYSAFRTDVGRFTYYFDWTQTVDKETWTVAERDNYPADTGRLRKLLLELAEARLLEEKTSNPELYDRLKVEDIA